MQTWYLVMPIRSRREFCGRSGQDPH